MRIDILLCFILSYDKIKTLRRLFISCVSLDEPTIICNVSHRSLYLSIFSWKKNMVVKRSLVRQWYPCRRMRGKPNGEDYFLCHAQLKTTWTTHSRDYHQSDTRQKMAPSGEKPLGKHETHDCASVRTYKYVVYVYASLRRLASTLVHICTFQKRQWFIHIGSSNSTGLSSLFTTWSLLFFVWYARARLHVLLIIYNISYLKSQSLTSTIVIK